MKRQIMLISEKEQSRLLLYELGRMARYATAKRKRPVSWLRYARLVNGMYQFLKRKNDQCEILTVIANAAHTVYPIYKTSEIVDLLGELVNTTVKDLITMYGFTTYKKNLPERENKFLRLPLIELVATEFYVPRYSWFMLNKRKSRFVCEAKNLVTGEDVLISKRKRKGFIQYRIYTRSLLSN